MNVAVMIPNNTTEQQGKKSVLIKIFQNGNIKVLRVVFIAAAIVAVLHNMYALLEYRSINHDIQYVQIDEISESSFTVKQAATSSRGIKKANDKDSMTLLKYKTVKPNLSYVVCNGLTNQLLGHAGYISAAIESGQNILIPNVFITNGVQNEKDSQDLRVLKNILPTRENSIPLSHIIDVSLLLEKINSYGVNAFLEPYETSIKRYEMENQSCDWLKTLGNSNHQTVREILQTIKPSQRLSMLIDTNLSNLSHTSVRFSNTTLSDGICLHHRDGQDWHDHCTQWEGINDGHWRKNCLNDRKLPLHELVKYRIPVEYPKAWIYYIGDSEPSDQMILDFKFYNQMDLIHREKNNLLSDADVSRTLHLDQTISKVTHRDLFAAIDFFTCSNIESFVGNSVSAFSATQIAIRGGMHSSWYNSRSIPLAPMLHVFNIPIVYTYTEESLIAGQHLLKASILSVRSAFGTSTDVHILYHGTKDHLFRRWLISQKVIIHQHTPKWLDDVENMRQHGDSSRSHLFQNKGNYIGTWQRVDIPHFVNAEYCLFLDSDTIVHSAFGMHNFGPAITPGLAVSQESSEMEAKPLNLGVALLNIPHLRETYDGFQKYIHSHAENPIFDDNNVSDQGAYLSYYKNTTEFLDWIFNVKPYWNNKLHFDRRKIVHFHGLKPQDILKIWMGYPDHHFSPAQQFLIVRIRQKKHSIDDSLIVCRAMYDFSRYISESDEILGDFCISNFRDDGENKVKTCKKFFGELSLVSESGLIKVCRKNMIDHQGLWSSF